MSDLSKGRNSAQLSIIPFHSQHYSALAELLTESYSDHHFDREGLRALDENLPAHCKFRRWMVFCEDICVAFGEYRQTPEMYHPHRFILNIVVKPAYRIRGIGTRIYAHIVSELEIFRYYTGKFATACGQIHDFATTARNQTTLSVEKSCDQFF